MFDLLRARLLFGELPRHTDDLEAAVTQVVRLLGIEREDSEGELFIGYQEGRDRAHPKTPGRLQSMAAVRRPEAVIRRHRDHGIKEQAGGADRLGQAGGVGLGEITLEGRGDDLLYGERREHERLSREGVAVGADHGATLLLHLRDQVSDVFAR